MSKWKHYEIITKLQGYLAKRKEKRDRKPKKLKGVK